MHLFWWLRLCQPLKNHTQCDFESQWAKHQSLVPPPPPTHTQKRPKKKHASLLFGPNDKFNVSFSFLFFYLMDEARVGWSEPRKVMAASSTLGLPHPLLPLLTKLYFFQTKKRKEIFTIKKGKKKKEKREREKKMKDTFFFLIFVSPT